jgi:hypothetical protein
LAEVSAVNDYWEECRNLYAPFESGQKAGSADVVSLWLFRSNCVSIFGAFVDLTCSFSVHS